VEWIPARFSTWSHADGKKGDDLPRKVAGWGPKEGKVTALQNYKVLIDGAVRNIKLDPAEPLNTTRARIGVSFTTHRFVYYNTVIGTKQVLDQQRVEPTRTLNDGFVFAPDTVLMANVTDRNSDFLGSRVQHFSDRHAKISVVRNTADPAPKPVDFDPIMLDDITMANEGADLGLDKAVICQEGTLLQFNMSCWGAAGWGYSIRSQRDVIADSLYSMRDGSYDLETSLTLRRYQKGGQTIRADSLSHAGIPDFQAAQYSKLTFRTWNVSSYARGKQVFTSHTPPPSLAQAWLLDGVAGAMAAVGDTIVSGGGMGKPSAGAPSGQSFHTIKINREDRQHVLGAAVFFLIVVKDAQQANSMLKIVNEKNALPV
jgi:hypothetical protein